MSFTVVHIIGSGRAGNWSVDLVRGLIDLKFEVVVICPEDGPLVERLHREKIPAIGIKFPASWSNFIQCFACMKEIVYHLKQIRPTIVHFHLASAIFPGRLAAKIAGVPVRISSWPGPAPLERRLIRLADILSSWMDTAIIATCKATMNIYKSYPYSSDVALIYYGIPLGRFDGSLSGFEVRKKFGVAADEFVFAIIAYMYPPSTGRYGGLGLKGHEIFIRAAELLHERGLTAGLKFWIVGGPLAESGRLYENALKQKVQRLAVAERILFTGFIRDVPGLLAGVDAVVVPSFSENVGGAVEPLLMGKPVVASNVGGLPDVVIPGVTGFLVEPGSPGKLAEAVWRMAALPLERRREMGREGRKVVSRLFDITTTCLQTKQLYEKLLIR